MGLRRLRGVVVELEGDRAREGVLGWERGLLGGREIVAGDGDRLGGAGQCVPDDGLVLVRHQEHPDRGLVLWPAQPVLDEGDIEAELASVARVEFRGLEFDDHVPEYCPAVNPGVLRMVTERRRSRAWPGSASGFV